MIGSFATMSQWRHNSMHLVFFFAIGLPVKIFKTVLPFSILATWLAHPNLLHLITPAILGKGYNLWNSFWILLYSLFSSLYPLIFASVSCFHIPLACMELYVLNWWALHRLLNVDNLECKVKTTVDAYRRQSYSPLMTK